MKREDEQLITACCQHDPVACKKLYDQYAAGMLGVIMRYVDDRDSAQDILHDGFVKVFTSLKTLRSSESLSSWIKRIMINTAITSLREFSLMQSIESADPACLIDVPVEEFLPYDAEQVAHAIRQLPEFTRTIFNLHAVDGYTYDELAKMYNVKPVSVRSHVCRAKMQLVQILKGTTN